MNKKTLIRVIIDLLMTLLMLLAFAYQLTGNLAHEVVGVVLIALFTAHNLMNWHWYKNLRKGKYTVRRVLGITVDLLLLANMGLLAISSVMLSRDLFGFLRINGEFVVRQLHTLTSYWGLVLMSVHLGIHWRMVLSAVRRMAGIGRTNRILTPVLRFLAVLIAGYGIKASLDMKIGSKLILYYTFDYWDFEESTIGFFIAYVAIMGLFMCVSYYALKWLGRVDTTTREIRVTQPVKRRL